MTPTGTLGEGGGGPVGGDRPAAYNWIVFALIVGLLISDYMSRQVLGAVFPALKVEWGLNDEQLGRLSSIVPLIVGLLTFPLSLLADRWGRVRAIVIMALLWSFATLLCGVARTYGEMFAARALIGLGEAAYGSVGIALVLSLFPARMRASLTAAFMAGGVAGSVLGVGLGGVLAAAHGWRWSFAGIALFGIVIALIFAAVVRERHFPKAAQTERAPISSVAGSRTLILVYIGSGLQLFMSAVLVAWLPSWLGRAHGMETAQAGQMAALILLAQGVGMIFWGIASDRISAANGDRRYQLCIALGIASAALLGTAFLLPPSGFQLAILAVGAFCVAGTSGPVGSLVAQLTPAALHGTAFAVVTLGNNLFGLAPGPWIAGRLADGVGLPSALAAVSLVPLLAASCFAAAHRASRLT